MCWDDFRTWPEPLLVMLVVVQSINHVRLSRCLTQQWIRQGGTYLAPHGRLFAGGQCVSVAQDVHAMFGSRQHDIDAIGRLQKTNCSSPAARFAHTTLGVRYMESDQGVGSV